MNNNNKNNNNSNNNNNNQKPNKKKTTTKQTNKQKVDKYSYHDREFQAIAINELINQQTLLYGGLHVRCTD